jgi:hypothetical protein
MISTGPVTRRPRGTPAALSALTGIACFVLLLYVIELVDTLLNNRLDQEGVEPQQTDGLLGILFAPLLHAGWGHLIGNTLPLLVLGFLVLLSGVRLWAGVTRSCGSSPGWAPGWSPRPTPSTSGRRC